MIYLLELGDWNSEGPEFYDALQWGHMGFLLKVDS